MIADVFRGARYFWRGISLINKPKVRVWAYLPMALTLMLYVGMIWVLYEIIWPLAAEHLPDASGDYGFLSTILRVLFLAGIGSLALYFFVITASLVACPFNGVLAEVVEEQQTGRPFRGDPLVIFAKRLPVMLVQETKKIIYYVFWSIPVGLVCVAMLITGFLSPIVPFIWGAFSAWMLALEFSDYPMDNNKLKFREMRHRLRCRRWTSFGFGLMTFLFAMIPLVNVVTVPAAVCGATIFWLEELKSLESMNQ